MKHKVSINEMSPELSTSAPCHDQPPSCGRKGRIVSLARVCAMALLLPSVADAWVINVQYGPNNNSDGQYANASMGGLTGPSADTGTTWNNFLGTGYGQNAYYGAQATNAALVSSTGAATSVKLDFLIPNNHGNALTGSNANSLPIFRSCGFSNGITVDFTLSGLTPGTLYDLYAISGGAPSETYVGTFHVTGAVTSASQTAAGTGPFTAFNSGNALLFADLAPTADGKLTLTLEDTSYGTSNGFQLVEHTSSYTLTYDANGGTGAQSDGSSPYASGTTVTVLGAGTIAQTGYTFTGWNTEAGGGGTPYAPGATFSITANTTLYAQWLINTYATWADNNSVTGGANGDSDHDGILNLVEYALALNPGASDGSAGTLTGRLLSFNKRAEAVTNGDVTYTIETSTNLQDSITPGDGGWTPVTPDTNDGSIISYLLPDGAAKIFARLRVRTLP